MNFGNSGGSSQKAPCSMVIWQETLTLVDFSSSLRYILEALNKVQHPASIGSCILVPCCGGVQSTAFLSASFYFYYYYYYYCLKCRVAEREKVRQRDRGEKVRERCPKHWFSPQAAWFWCWAYPDRSLKMLPGLLCRFSCPRLWSSSDVFSGHKWEEMEQ